MNNDKLQALACMAALLAGGPALAQDPAATYPARPVTVIIVVSPGGSAEGEARIYTPKLQESLGKPFVFDYKPGAGGTIGYAAAAKAAPDGYTLLATTPAFTTTPALMPLSYDPVKDFAPVVQLGRAPGLLVVHPSVPITSMSEYMAYGRANPGKLNFGTMGAGSTSHLVGAWLAELTQTQLTMIHYKGAQLMTDLLAGNLQITAGSAANVGSLVKAGKARAVAMAGPVRAAGFPDVRTAREQGVNFDYPSWVGLTVPSGTPMAIIGKLNAEILRLQKQPDILQAIERQGSMPAAGTPAEFGRLLNEEIERWKALVKKSGIKLES